MGYHLKDTIHCTECRYSLYPIKNEPCTSCPGPHGEKNNFERVIVSEKSINDNVNHPSHYTTGKYECIDIMLEIFGVEAVKTFCLLNAFKYNYRSGRKNGLEDIQKAKWYIDKYIELSE